LFPRYEQAFAGQLGRQVRLVQLGREVFQVLQVSWERKDSLELWDRLDQRVPPALRDSLDFQGRQDHRVS